MAWLPYRQCRSWRVARAKLGVLWATPKTLYLNNRTTAGPIGLRLGIQQGTQQTIHHFSIHHQSLWVIFRVLQHVRTYTPRFYISRTAEPIELIFGM